MCGICGHTNDSRRTGVAGMNAAMAARGRDDVRTFTDYFSGVSLGARRLSIIDVQGGRQPATNEDLTVWAVLNGEIHNHRALRETLQGRGHRFTSGVDTEVLVHLYEEHGPAMVHLLEGMYAFAIWDARREELLVVRDRLGEKPLFYAEQHRDLLFASKLDALLTGLNREPQLDAASVDAFFGFGYVPGPASIVRGVRQLPPGHVLRWERRSRRIQVDPYWSSATTQASSSGEPFDELVAETGRLLTRSVRSHLVADVPLGVLLSGGLHSTLLAALAARISGKTIKTFTVGYPTGAVGETAQARATAETLETEHHELVLTEGQLLERVPTLLAGMDQPLADPGLVFQHAIAEHAMREVTVAVGGDGADELFGSSSRYRWLGRSDPNWTTAQQPALRRRLYGPALRGAVEQTGPATARLMVLDERHRLPHDTLVKADRAGMRASLEVRTPYLSRELAEFAGTVSERIHVRDGGRALLHALLARMVPKVTVRDPNPTPWVPAAEWLRGPMAPLVDDQLAQGSAFAENWLDRRGVTALVAEHRAGTRDASNAIWPLLSFGLWLDRIRGRDRG